MVKHVRRAAVRREFRDRFGEQRGFADAAHAGEQKIAFLLIGEKFAERGERVAPIHEQPDRRQRFARQTDTRRGRRRQRGELRGQRRHDFLRQFVHLRRRRLQSGACLR